MKYKTADLYDQYGDTLKVAEPLFQNYGGLLHFHGPIYTIRVHQDFKLVKETLMSPGEGQVLIVDGGGFLGCALLGDRLAEMGVDHEWSGIIINGCIRDSEEISRLAIGVKAINTCPVRPAFEAEGEREINLQFAGVNFRMGDYVYADRDGIVVSETEL